MWQTSVQPTILRKTLLDLKEQKDYIIIIMGDFNTTLLKYINHPDKIQQRNFGIIDMIYKRS
jgi:hypothetical protein